MASKVERLEARLTPVQRRQIEQAAALAGESVSAFMVLAALERTESTASRPSRPTHTDWPSSAAPQPAPSS